MVWMGCSDASTVTLEPRIRAKFPSVRIGDAYHANTHGPCVLIRSGKCQRKNDSPSCQPIKLDSLGVLVLAQC
ncbi:unnamed protein product [Cyprideis torosa]|uniref:Uncharacterized protein n=1 Tax=Cyprideis torosa TaxID=163714 RepID=A0A7R8WQ44_9CRUS|nr:unnamed protein product [Cyprideis torosa]CAG0905614.1 unnamed protein product [Cyprideis torosa]